MSAHRAGHDTRCERSATDAKRCQCDCDGNLHGAEVRRQAIAAVASAHERGVITDDEYRIARLRLEP